MDHVVFLQKLVDTDVAQVRAGLPEGAQKIAPMLAKGSADRDNPTVLKQKLSRVRSDVKGLFVAKSTFLVIVDEKGVALRNEFEPDAVAGKNLRKALPPSEAAFKGTAVEFSGTFAELAGIRDTSRDREWIAAAPVPDASGAAGSDHAVLLTGWSYRLFARHLHESLKSDIMDAVRAGKTREPLWYTGVFDETGVYMSFGTPQIDEDILTKESPFEKTKNGPFHAPILITDRHFGYAAARTPAMGANTGVIVLRSEI